MFTYLRRALCMFPIPKGPPPLLLPGYFIAKVTSLFLLCSVFFVLFVGTCAIVSVARQKKGDIISDIPCCLFVGF